MEGQVHTLILNFAHSTLKRYNRHNLIDDTSFIAAMTFGGSTLILGLKYDQ